MPIINSVIASGPAPTGTIQITNNGTTNVADYEYADVQVPTTAPERYLELGKDSNNYLIKAGTTMVNLNGITGLSENILAYAYLGSTALSGSIDLSNIVTIKKSALRECFKSCPNITSVSVRDLTTVEDDGMRDCFNGCTGITNSSLDFSNLATVGQYGLNNAFYNCSSLVTNNINLSGLTTVKTYSFNNAFYNCSHITGSVDLSSVTTIESYGLYSAFSGCTGITSFDLGGLESISANYVCAYMFSRCTGLTSVDLSSLKTIGSSGSNAFQEAFKDCTGIITVNLSSLTEIPANSVFYNAFTGCTGLTSVNMSNIYKVSGSSCCIYMFKGCSNLTTVNMGAVRFLSGNGCCQYMFEGCSSLASFDMSKVMSFSTNAFQYMFHNCTSLTELSFDGFLISNTNYNSAFYNTLLGCTGVTVHFPSNWATAMASWSNIQNGMGGTNTTILWDLPAQTIVDLSNITKITVNSEYYGAFKGNNSITGFNLDNLVAVTGYTACQQMFMNCNGITQANLPKLELATSYVAIGELCRNDSNVVSFNLNRLTDARNGYTLSHTFDGCDITGDASFPSLYAVGGSQPFQGCFTNCRNLTSLSFPALRICNSGSSDFPQMLTGVTGCTVHFPSNLSSKNFSGLSGTNTTILYDLPATRILTGANTVKYERNPIDDTTTALAWRKNEYDSEGLVVDWTSVYTSGTTDPVVGDTLYSDSACTTAVTTIDSIA